MFYISNVCSLKVHLYVCLQEKAFYISIYNEHMFGRRYTYTSLSRPYSFSIILYLYTKEEYSFPHISYPFRMFLIYSFIIYSIYRYREYFSATFTTFPALSLPFIILLLYIEEETFSPPPFSPYICSYKVNTFSTAHFLTLIVWEKVCGEKFLKTLLV